MSIFDEEPGSRPLRAGFILTEKFSLMAFASTLEPLRAVNTVLGETLYEWVLLTVDGAPVHASSGLQVVPEGKLDDSPYDAVFVIGGLETERIDDPVLSGFLRRSLRMGATLIGVSTASFIFARAGLLDNRRSTVHWDYIDGFREDFPHLEVSGELYEMDGPVITCAGGAAGMDLMMHLIGQRHGHGLATRIGDWFVQNRIRDRHEHQRTDLRTRIGVSNPKLLAAIAIMEANLETPLTREEIAVEIGLSTRQLERLFRKYLSATPKKYYFSLRMQKARQLLRQTSMPILDIAIASGFVSASHFAKCYREFFGRTPRGDRGPSA